MHEITCICTFAHIFNLLIVHSCYKQLLKTEQAQSFETIDFLVRLPLDYFQLQY